MKKSILLASMLSMSFMFCEINACDRKDVVSKAKSIERSAICELKQKGISKESVDYFTEQIQKSINMLSEKEKEACNYNGRVSDQLAIQYDLLTLAKTLYSFKEAPDPQKAQELRKIAMSSSMKVLGLIKIVMDEMNDPLCKFSLPIDNTNLIAGDDNFFEGMQGRLTKKRICINRFISVKM